MTERKPFKVDDPYVWLGSQLEHPGESAELTPSAESAESAGDSDTADTGVTNRPSGGAAYLVVMALVGVLGTGLLFWLYLAGGRR